MAGAFSGTALIGAAIVAFVLLVSLQALRDWPLAGIGGSSGGGAAQERTNVGKGTTQGPASAQGGRATAGTGAHRNGADRTNAVGHAGTGVGGPPPAGTNMAKAPESGQAGSVGGSTGSSSGSAGGESSGGSTSAGEAVQSVTGTAAKTVDETVSGVDEATGGALGETGVTKVTEETVNGLHGATP
jgi:hypothetical protein